MEVLKIFEDKISICYDLIVPKYSSHFALLYSLVKFLKAES